MKSWIKQLGYLLLILGSSLHMVACDKEGNDEEDETKMDLAFDKTEFQQSEVVGVAYTGDYTGELIKASINGKELPMLLQDGSLYFLIPNDIEGRAVISAPGFSQDYTITIRRIYEHETDPDQYMADVIAEHRRFHEDVDETVDSLISFGVLTSDVAEGLLKQAGDSIAYGLAQFSKLTDAQKQDAIYFLKANAIQVQPIKALIERKLKPLVQEMSSIRRTQASAPSVLSACAHEEVLRQVQCVILTELVPAGYRLVRDIVACYAVATLSASTVVGSLVGVGVSVSIVKYSLVPNLLKFKAVLWSNINRVMEYVGTAADRILGSGSGQRSSVHRMFYDIGGSTPHFMATSTSSTAETLNNNLKYKLDYRILARNLQLNSSLEGFGELFDMYNSLMRIYALPFSYKLFGAKPNWPKKEEKYVRPQSVKHFTVECDNPKVSGAVSGTAENLEITFKSNESENQRFNYTIVYNDGINKEVRSPQKSAVLNVLPSDYTIEIYDKVLTYRYPDATTSKGNFVATLQPGDEFTTDTGAEYYIILKYKGNEVPITPEGEIWDFIALGGDPMYRQNDHRYENYVITLTDVTNSQKINFPLQLTLRNHFYRSVVGKTLRINHGGGSFIDLKLNADGSLSGFYDRTYTYYLGLSRYSFFIRDCSNRQSYEGTIGTIKRGRPLGSISLNFHGDTPGGLPTGSMMFMENGEVWLINECFQNIEIR